MGFSQPKKKKKIGFDYYGFYVIMSFGLEERLGFFEQDTFSSAVKKWNSKRTTWEMMRKKKSKTNGENLF